MRVFLTHMRPLEAGAYGMSIEILGAAAEQGLRNMVWETDHLENIRMTLWEHEIDEELTAACMIVYGISCGLSYSAEEIASTCGERTLNLVKAIWTMLKRIKDDRVEEAFLATMGRVDGLGQDVVRGFTVYSIGSMKMVGQQIEQLGQGHRVSVIGDLTVEAFADRFDKIAGSIASIDGPVSEAFLRQWGELKPVIVELEPL
jgi:hypothetical protein